MSFYRIERHYSKGVPRVKMERMEQTACTRFPQVFLKRRRIIRLEAAVDANQRSIGTFLADVRTMSKLGLYN